MIKIEDKIKKDYNGGHMIPTSITVHNTNPITTSKGRTMAQQYADAQNADNMKGCYVHFYVDKESIVQCLPLNAKGVHAGNSLGNATSIAIEGIGVDSWENTVKLVKYLLKENPKLTIKTHKDWSGKSCPEYFLPNWDKFLADVKKEEVHPFKNAIDWVEEVGISDGTRPDDNITRGEMFEILRRYHTKFKDVK